MSITGWDIEWKSGYNGGLNLNWNYENINDTLEFSDDVYILPGEYSFGNMECYFQTPGGNDLSLYPHLTAGRFYDGFRLSPSLGFTWGLSPGFILDGNYRIDWVKFSGRNQELLNNIIRLTIKVMTSTKVSFSTFAQYNTAIDGMITNFRFRYNPKEGSDLYIVYNEGLNTNLDREIPTLPRSDNRSVLIKYTYTFDF